MPFCQNCGRPLAEGEVCQCRNMQGAPQNSPYMKNPGQPYQNAPYPGQPNPQYPGQQQYQYQYQQGQPQQATQNTRPFTTTGQAPAAEIPQGGAFTGGQPQHYQPLFNSNGQVTGQTGGFQPIPQGQTMETDAHGVPGFLRRKK